MLWGERFGKETQPSWEALSAFIANPLWEALFAYMEEAYGAKPKMVYSGCSMMRGWNVKFQKSGKALCTLYPMEGLFTALVVAGPKEMTPVELLIPALSPYTQALFARTETSMNSKWLMMEVTSEEILSDLKQLMALRVPVKQK